MELMGAAKTKEQRTQLANMYQLKEGKDKAERQPMNSKRVKTEGAAAKGVTPKGAARDEERRIREGLARDDELRSREEQLNIRERRQRQREERAEWDDSDDSDDDRGRRRKRSRGGSRSRKRRSRSSSDSSEEERGEDPRACLFYKRGYCRYGDECEAKHLKVDSGGRGRTDRKKQKKGRR